ncbi:MAG: hypothetical protein K8S98_06270 [Planctomycetes bacterium]|nr:hypothetical protein [Planctomycetota bacterium]
MGHPTPSNRDDASTRRDANTADKSKREPRGVEPQRSPAPRFDDRPGSSSRDGDRTGERTDSDTPNRETPNYGDRESGDPRRLDTEVRAGRSTVQSDIENRRKETERRATPPDVADETDGEIEDDPSLSN